MVLLEIAPIPDRLHFTPWLFTSLATDAVMFTDWPCSIVGDNVGFVMVTVRTGVVEELEWQPAATMQTSTAHIAKSGCKTPLTIANGPRAANAIGARGCSGTTLAVLFIFEFLAVSKRVPCL
jgi:hypothetical protein